MSLPPSFQAMLMGLTMTHPTLINLMTVLVGWVFAHRRTITGMIQAAGAGGMKHYSTFHRLFSSARWSLDAVGLALVPLLLPFAGSGTLFLAVDDTLARKRGLKVFGAGMHHDPLLSSRNKAVMNWGHSWVVLGVLVSLPFRPDHWFSLPILFRLYRSKQTIAREGGDHFTRPELALQMLRMLCEAFPDQRFHLVADSTYSGRSVVRLLPENCHFTGRIHLDAQLFTPPPKRRPGAMGRPRKKGERRPSPRAMLGTARQPIELSIYGRTERVALAHCTALWYKTAGQRPLTIVAVKPLTGGRPSQAFYSTALEATPTEVLTWYARRWALEVAFHDTKGYLGFEQPQSWTKQAVLRTAPMAMLLYTLICLWFTNDGHVHCTLSHRPWYPHKNGVAFPDMLQTLRYQCLRQDFHLIITDTNLSENHRKYIEMLIELTARAA